MCKKKTLQFLWSTGICVIYNDRHHQGGLRLQKYRMEGGYYNISTRKIVKIIRSDSAKSVPVQGLPGLDNGSTVPLPRPTNVWSTIFKNFFFIVFWLKESEHTYTHTLARSHTHTPVKNKYIEREKLYYYVQAANNQGQNWFGFWCRSGSCALKKKNRNAVF